MYDAQREEKKSLKITAQEHMRDMESAANDKTEKGDKDGFTKSDPCPVLQKVLGSSCRIGLVLMLCFQLRFHPRHLKPINVRYSHHERLL